ncbi:MAG: iron ABC transporter permease [Oscillospiraceae bacterium]|nr:iron ABC transporter permease [Oscillospiraceae bacterium]
MTKPAAKNSFIIPLLILIPLAVALLSICTGRYPISPASVFKALWQGITGRPTGVTSEELTIITGIRLPRTIMGAFVGGALAASGTAFQGIFRNPLVNSGILGVSSGASLGAALSILVFSNYAFTAAFAFAFGLLAVFLSCMVGRIHNSTTTVTLVLGGTIISSIFTSLLSFVKYIADPMNQLPAITFWTMGSLASTISVNIKFALVPIIVGLMMLIFSGWNINVLSMGDAEAGMLGLNVRAAKLIVITGATLATAGAVCISGAIGWVGLVVPHIARIFMGNDNRRLMPAGISMGASFLMLIDVLCRVISTAEIPLGIMTSLIGGPFFIYLIKKKKGNAWV